MASEPAVTSPLASYVIFVLLAPIISPFNATAPKPAKVWSPVFVPEILLIVVA